MSFEIALQNHSRKARLVLLLAVSFCALLCVTAPIALLAKVLILLIFSAITLVSFFQKQFQVILTFDGAAWFIDTPTANYTAAQLQSVRSFVWCCVLTFIDADGDKYHQTVWRDQVSNDAWRRLSVFGVLKQLP